MEKKFNSFFLIKQIKKETNKGLCNKTNTIRKQLEILSWIYVEYYTQQFVFIFFSNNVRNIIFLRGHVQGYTLTVLRDNLE